MKILVTGANGMLGQDLCPILEDVGAFVIETDVDTLDLTQAEIVEQVVTDIHPDMVVHCAAYTAVDKAEEEPEKAELINVKGTENISKICGKLDIPIVYISTDYVFDGTKTTPYTSEDATNPQSVYGRTKLGGEEMVKKYCEKYYIARTSWLYGHHGKNFVETMLSLAEKGGEIKVVDDQIGCPTWTVELANGILKLLSKPYGTYHVCGSGSTSWYGFAKEIFEQAGYSICSKGHSEQEILRAEALRMTECEESQKSVQLISCTTEEFPRPAKRPAYSVMDNQNICRNWQAALHDYLELKDV